MAVTRLRLKQGREYSIKRGHPWVFSGALQETPPSLRDGDIVEAWSADGNFVGVGHFAQASIAIKILSFRNRAIDADFWRERLRQAFTLRQVLGLIDNPKTTAFRLVNAEGDQLPGLIIDIYGTTAVLQLHSVGMQKSKLEIVEALKEICGTRISSIFCRKDPDDTQPEATAARTEKGEYLLGTGGSTEVLENGYRFKVDWEHGQKTGYFLDQRENRKLVGSLAKGRSVLDAFCYSGGFSVYAHGGGAKEVHSVDASKATSELVAANVKNNAPEAKHQHLVADCLNYLDTIDGKFDLIILDPPAFAKHRAALSGATPGYRRINHLAIKNIAKGGLLFTFSCSHFMDRELFRQTIMEAAVQADRNVRVLYELGHPPCHPVALLHPEGRYLKGFGLLVE